MNMNLSTSDSRVSPVVDLDRVSVILTSNIINNPISNYVLTSTSTLTEDPSAFVYATKSIALEVPANAIKVLFSAYINQTSDVRVHRFKKNHRMNHSTFHSQVMQILQLMEQ